MFPALPKALPEVLDTVLDEGRRAGPAGFLDISSPGGNDGEMDIKAGFFVLKNYAALIITLKTVPWFSRLSTRNLKL